MRKRAKSAARQGLILATINSAISIFCIVSFFGLLWLAVILGAPFPFPILFMLYPAMFIVSWSIFAARAVFSSSGEAWRAAQIGSTPASSSTPSSQPSFWPPASSAR